VARLIPAILEKLAFGIAAPILSMHGRVLPAVLAFGVLNLVLATLFFVAMRKTVQSPRLPSESPKSA
jgi:hypothetical protein